MTQLAKITQVTVWRDTMPADVTKFVSTQLKPGEQLDIKDQRIKFKVERAHKRTPNQCDVWISNLAEGTRGDLETSPLTVQLLAGYDGAPRLLFTGDMRFAASEQEGPTWTTLLQCGDGSRSYAHARVSKSYRGGTTVRTILKDAAASMGLALPSNLDSDPALDAQFQTGVVAHGPTRNELDRLLAPYGYHWSVQNGVLMVLSDDQVASNMAIPIDEQHGMIGTPKFGSPPRSGKPPHVKVKNVIYPELEPGALAYVTSRGIRGLYRVERAVHSGDTHSRDPDVTEVELQPTAMTAGANLAMVDVQADVFNFATQTPS